MTHDLTYKRKRAIPPGLRGRFTDLSTQLDTADVIGQRIRVAIEDLLAQAHIHRELAVRSFLGQIVDALGGLRADYPGIPDVGADVDVRSLVFAPEQVALIDEALRDERAKKGLKRDHCFIAAFVALCSKAPAQAAFAIQQSNDWVMLSPTSAWAEMLRASILWALGRFDGGVDSAEQALLKAESEAGLTEKSKRNLLCSFCYYVTDAKVFHTFIPRRTEDRVRELAQGLSTAADDPSFLDTAGFVRIVLGQDEADVRAGLALVQSAVANAQGAETTLANAFGARHKALARMRLDGELGWWK